MSAVFVLARGLVKAPQTRQRATGSNIGVKPEVSTVDKSTKA